MVLENYIQCDQNENQEVDFENSAEYHYWRRTLVTSFCWMILPFLMSSNLLVYVGFVVADRTLYLPSFGFCLLLVQGLLVLVSIIVPTNSNNFKVKISSPTRSFQMLYGTIAFFILGLYAIKQQRQTKRWSDPVLLWGQAYRINPQSCINGKEYGMALVNALRPKDAVPILMSNSKRELKARWFVQTIEKTRRRGQETSDETKLAEMSRMAGILHTRFKLVTAMGNSGDCKGAMPLINEGLTWIEHLLQDIDNETAAISHSAQEVHRSTVDGTRSFSDLKEPVLQSKAFLLVAKTRCADNLVDMAKYAYNAVIAKPGMDYSMQHAQSVNDIITQLQAQNINIENVEVTRKVGENSQTAHVSFNLRA